MKDKKELKFFTSYLKTDHEYTIDELKNECEETLKIYKNNQEHVHAATKQNYIVLDKYTINSTLDYDYDSSTYPKFQIQFYRLESDEEYNNRLEKEKKKKEAEEKLKIKKEEQRKIKEEKQRKKEEDPEYKKYLELQNKFKNK